jgi:hypothetical protein
MASAQALALLLFFCWALQLMGTAAAGSEADLPEKLLPSWLLQLVLPLQDLPRTLDAVEFFAGDGQITAALQRAAFNVRAVDAASGEAESNLGSTRGFRNALSLIMQVKASGFIWLAPPCSAWVFLSSSWHGRSPENGYRGKRRKHFADIRDANSLAVVVAMCILVARWRNVGYIMEQPSNSKLYKYGPIRRALRATQASKVSTYLQSFCPTFPLQKALSLVFTCPWAQQLARRQPGSIGSQSSSCYEKDACTGRVSGRPALSETAAYPREFGQKVFSLSVFFFPWLILGHGLIFFPCALCRYATTGSTSCKRQPCISDLSPFWRVAQSSQTIRKS